MDADARLKSLLPLWSWLPAFRAIAETGHLPSAAKLCGIGPSSLSRSLAMLERTVRRPLFSRAGRSLTINPEGELLLAAVREAMRGIDDALQELAGRTWRGVLRIGSSSAGTTALIAPAIERLRREHPQLLAQISSRSSADVVGDLLRGQLDVAFQESPTDTPGLVSQQVGSLARSVYCGRRHELFGVTSALAQPIEAAEFVAPPPLADGVMADGWPAERPRRIVVIADQLRVGIELCIEQPLLAVLPDILASQRPNELWRLPAVPIPASRAFAICRKALGPKPSPAAHLIEWVRDGSAPPTDLPARP